MNPQDIKYQTALADSLISAQAYEPAGHAIDQALHLSKEPFDLLVRKASVMSHTATMADKISFAEGLIRQYPRHSAFYDLLGDLYQTSGAIDRAEEIYRKMTQDFPMDSKGYLQLGILYGKTGSMKKAKQQFESAVRYDAGLQKNPEVKKVLQYQGS